MADPITLAVIGITAAGTLYTGFSGYQAGLYRAEVAEMNQKVAKENADRARFRSQADQQAQDAQTAAMVGQQEADQAASGLNIESRSHAQTRRAARELGRLDALNVRQAGEVEAYNYLVDAENFKSEASASRSEAFSSLVEGFLGAAGDVVGGLKAKPSLVGGSTATSKSFVTGPYPYRRPVLI